VGVSAAKLKHRTKLVEALVGLSLDRGSIKMVACGGNTAWKNEAYIGEP